MQGPSNMELVSCCHALHVALLQSFDAATVHSSGLQCSVEAAVGRQEVCDCAWLQQLHSCTNRHHARWWMFTWLQVLARRCIECFTNANARIRTLSSLPGGNGEQQEYENALKLYQVGWAALCAPAG
jgi:hypothetical protein